MKNIYTFLINLETIIILLVLLVSLLPGLYIVFTAYTLLFYFLIHVLTYIVVLQDNGSSISNSIFVILYYFFIKKYSIFIIDNKLHLYKDGAIFTHWIFFFSKERYSNNYLNEITKGTHLRRYNRIFLFQK